MSKAKIESILYEYPVLKSQIEMEMVDAFCELSSVCYEDVSGGKTNDVHSSVEELIMAKLKKEEKLAEMISKRDKIEASLRCLSANEIKAIRLKYFKDEKAVNIAFELGVDSTTTVYNYINKGIGKLKKTGLHKLKEVL